MTMADDDTELNQLFAQARAGRRYLPDDLAVRIMTDAEQVRLDRLAKPVPPAIMNMIRTIMKITNPIMKIFLFLFIYFLAKFKGCCKPECPVISTPALPRNM